MSSSSYIDIIYKRVKQELGPTKAKEYVSSLMFNLLFDLEEESGSVTAEALEAKLKEEADFCSKKPNQVA